MQIVLSELKISIAFKAAFEHFTDLCHTTLNPNLSQAAVIEMLVQHLLTERLFRTIFNNSDFINNNVIAREIETVIKALTDRSFNRTEFLKSLDRFYVAIEETSRTIHAYSRKQEFLNVVYENFFQGFTIKMADTHGIVYTPQPIIVILIEHLVKIFIDFQKFSLPRQPNKRIGFICLSAIGSLKAFHCLIASIIPDMHLTGDSQCFPFYTYNKDGTNRQENLTDWALQAYQTHYHDQSIDKWSIFYYIYGLLHHQGYRDKYAANLKRELPRIPYAPDFWGISRAGAQLANLHLNYETQPEYPLKPTVTDTLDWRVEKMRLNKDKTAIIYNPSLTLNGIPAAVFDYRLGNRSALEWVIDQYQVTTDKRSGIVNDPNRPDDERYIVRLVQQIITVSLETVRLVKEISGST